MDKLTIEQEVWQTIQKLNRLWTVENKPDELVHFFHDTMIAITPSSPFRIEGKDACVESWKYFSENTKIHYWKATNPKIELYGKEKFAIVAYYFEMSFDMGGKTVDMKGRDMFSLVKENDKWLVVANQFSQFPN